MPENKLLIVSMHPLHNTILTPQETKPLLSDQVFLLTRSWLSPT